MASELNFIYDTAKGIERTHNQDRILSLDTEEYWIFLLFDGVSSLSESYLFIEEYISNLKRNLKYLLPEATNLEEIFFNSHEQSLQVQVQGKSTLSSIIIGKQDRVARIINIGDSRVYQFNNQFLEQITLDDSLEGRSNVLTKCLGQENLILMDFKAKLVQGRFSYLLCTDGFYSLMNKDLAAYFKVFQFKKLNLIKKKLRNLQEFQNSDDSSYILIKNEV